MHADPGRRSPYLEVEVFDRGHVFNYLFISFIHFFTFALNVLLDTHRQRQFIPVQRKADTCVDCRAFGAKERWEHRESRMDIH